MRELLRTAVRRALVPSSRKTSSVVSRVHIRFARFKMVISCLRLKSGFPRLRTDCMPYAHRGCERVIRRGPHPLGVQPCVHGLSSVLIVVECPGARTGWWPACSRRHGPNLGAHVVGFELEGERRWPRARCAADPRGRYGRRCFGRPRRARSRSGPGGRWRPGGSARGRAGGQGVDLPQGESGAD